MPSPAAPRVILELTWHGTHTGPLETPNGTIRRYRQAYRDSRLRRVPSWRVIRPRCSAITSTWRRCCGRSGWAANFGAAPRRSLRPSRAPPRPGETRRHRSRRWRGDWRACAAPTACARSQRCRRTRVIGRLIRILARLGAAEPGLVFPAEQDHHLVPVSAPRSSPRAPRAAPRSGPDAPRGPRCRRPGCRARA